MKRILIVGPSWVGDLVMAQALIQTLHAKLNHPLIDMTAPPWCAELLSRMPGLRGTFSLPFAHGEWQFFQRYQWGKRLRGQYDQAIVLPKSWKAAVIPWSARIPQRTGHFGECRWGLINDIRPIRQPKTIQQFMALGFAKDQMVDAICVPQITADAAHADALIERLHLSNGQPIIGLCVGAEYGPAKRWPSSHFATLIQQLVAAEYRVWLFGSAKDVPMAAAIQQTLPTAVAAECHDLVGKTRLIDAVDLLSVCAAVVSNDSGLMHLAAALGRPTIGLFGSSSEHKTPPVGPHVCCLSVDLPCRPCFQRNCRLGHLKCLHDLSPAQVFLSLRYLLAGGSDG